MKEPGDHLPPIPVDATAPAEYEPITPGGKPPRWVYAPFHLLFRPSIFFRDYVVRPVPLLTAFAAWALGLAQAMERMERRVLQADLAGRQLPFMSLLTDWRIYWLTLAGGAVISGALYYFIGGWWYRRRLMWSGAVQPDPKMARRVYLMASLVFAFPSLLYLIWETFYYDTPLAAARGDDLLSFVILGALFWSVATSYRGSRTAFTLRPGASRLWFLILPMVVYSVALVGLFSLFQLAPDRPNLTTPVSIDQSRLSLTHPSNWMLETDPAMDDPDTSFTISPVIADALFRVFVYDWNVSPEQEVEETVETLSENIWFGTRTPMDRWGRYQGRGAEFAAEIDGKPFRIRIFCANHGDVAFEVWELAESARFESLEPGFALIRDSFRMKDPAQESRRGIGSSPVPPTNR